ncbi:hypothetical protein LQ26_004175 [Salmonella enterica subsp. enterica]|nr:hypothetical protein [Salmonella enterica subsp. enterica]
MQRRFTSGNPRFEGVTVFNTVEHQSVGAPVRHGKLLIQSGWAGGITAIPFPAARCLFVASGNGSTPTVEYRSRQLFDGQDMPRKRLEGRALNWQGHGVKSQRRRA